MDAFINKDSKVLEMGPNIGFISVNINLLTGVNAAGLGINEISIKKLHNTLAQFITQNLLHKTDLPDLNIIVVKNKKKLPNGNKKEGLRKQTL